MQQCAFGGCDADGQDVVKVKHGPTGEEHWYCGDHQPTIDGETWQLLIP